MTGETGLGDDEESLGDDGECRVAVVTEGMVPVMTVAE
jgi:hypothetical protein